MPTSAIVIPCYNEAARLRPDALAGLAAAPGVRLLLVDDGSRDGTPEALAAFARDRANVEVLALARNQGKAEAVRQGLLRVLRAEPDIVGFLDADLATPVEEALRMLALMAVRPEAVVMGSRVQLLGTRIERHWYRHYFGRVFATAASLILGIAVYDTQCGAKFFRPTPALRAALAQPFSARWVFDVELFGRLLAGAPGAPALRPEDFLEVPLQVWRDVGGSKLKLGDLLGVPLHLWAVWRALARWRRKAG